MSKTNRVQLASGELPPDVSLSVVLIRHSDRYEPNHDQLATASDDGVSRQVRRVDLYGHSHAIQCRYRIGAHSGSQQATLINRTFMIRRSPAVRAAQLRRRTAYYLPHFRRERKSELPRVILCSERRT